MDALYREWLCRYGVTDLDAPNEAQTRVFERALRHRSTDRKTSNERLEFLGDAVLQLAVVSYLYDRFPDQDEGFMTRMRTRLVNGQMVGTYARQLGMEPWLKVRTDSKREATNVLEDAFEAWLGSLFENHGFDVAKRWLVAFIERHVDMCDLIAQRRDFKSRLFQYFAATYRCEPGMERGQERARGGGGSGDVHVTTVKDADGRCVAQGRGATSRAADEAASRAALQYYSVIF
jgi:ribonuclease-3